MHSWRSASYTDIRGFIYMIYNENDKSDYHFYIGSTANDAPSRWGGHVRGIIYGSSPLGHHVKVSGGKISDWRMCVIEKCICPTEIALKQRETMYLRILEPHFNRAKTAASLRHQGKYDISYSNELNEVLKRRPANRDDEDFNYYRNTAQFGSKNNAGRRGHQGRRLPGYNQIISNKRDFIKLPDTIMQLSYDDLQAYLSNIHKNYKVSQLTIWETYKNSSEYNDWKKKGFVPEGVPEISAIREDDSILKPPIPEPTSYEPPPLDIKTDDDVHCEMRNDLNEENQRLKVYIKDLEQHKKLNTMMEENNHLVKLLEENKELWGLLKEKESKIIALQEDNLKLMSDNTEMRKKFQSITAISSSII